MTKVTGHRKYILEVQSLLGELYWAVVFWLSSNIYFSVPYSALFASCTLLAAISFLALVVFCL